MSPVVHGLGFNLDRRLKFTLQFRCGDSDLGVLNAGSEPGVTAWGLAFSEGIFSVRCHTVDSDRRTPTSGWLDRKVASARGP